MFDYCVCVQISGDRERETFRGFLAEVYVCIDDGRFNIDHKIVSRDFDHNPLGLRTLSGRIYGLPFGITWWWGCSWRSKEVTLKLQLLLVYKRRALWMAAAAAGLDPYQSPPSLLVPMFCCNLEAVIQFKSTIRLDHLSHRFSAFSFNLQEPPPWFCPELSSNVAPANSSLSSVTLLQLHFNLPST